MAYPTPTTIPRVLSVFTSVTPLANVRQYNYVGFWPGVMNPTGAAFTNAPVTKLVGLRTGVRFPYAILPIKFKV